MLNISALCLSALLYAHLLHVPTNRKTHSTQLLLVTLRASPGDPNVDIALEIETSSIWV